MKRIKALVLFLALLFMMPFVCLAEEPGIINVDSVSAKSGETVEIKVDMANNPGIIALCISVDYDRDVLVLSDAVDGKLFKGATSTFSKSVNTVPYTMIWEDALARENHTETGTLVILKFRIVDTSTVNKTSVKINISQPSTFDIDLNDVTFKVNNGSVTINSDSLKPTKKPVSTIENTSVQQTTIGNGSFPEIVSGVTEKNTTKYSQIQVDNTEKNTDTVSRNPATLKPCEHRDTRWQVVFEPNCFSAGKSKMVCLDCGLTLRVEKVDSSGHRLGDWYQTDSEDSDLKTEERVCVECGFREIRKLASDNSIIETQTDISNVVIPIISEQTERSSSDVCEDMESTDINKQKNDSEPKSYITITGLAVLMCLVVAIPLSVRKIKQGR